MKNNYLYISKPNKYLIMKKIYLLAAISLFGFTNAQQRPSDAEMAPIFAKMEKIENPAAAFPKGFFTTQEEKMITDYYRPDTQHTTPAMNFFANNDAHVLDSRNVARSYGNFPYAGPYNLNVTGSIPNTRAIYADDFDENGVLYALDNTSRKLVTVDPATAAVTEIATLNGIPTTETLGGLAFNYVNNQFYILSSSTAGMQLYTLNKTTGATSLIGVTPGISGIWLVIDNTGNAYTADITNDNLHQVNLSTGVATLIGPLGININFAQDADVNTADNNIYMAGYLGGGAGGIYTVNKTTGAATLLGSTTSNNAEYTMFSIENPNPLGVNDSAVKNGITIYPNPVGDVLNIVSGNKVDGAEIYSADGKMLMKQKSENAVNVSALKPGVYLLKTTSNGNSQSVKFIKK